MHERVASEILVEARGNCGLSQSTLARRARMPQPVVSAYERGRREPSVEALSRLATALGLRVELTRAPRRSITKPLPDLHRNGDVLRQVLDLADHLPRRHRGALEFPPLPRDDVDG